MQKVVMFAALAAAAAALGCPGGGDKPVVVAPPDPSVVDPFGDDPPPPDPAPPALKLSGDVVPRRYTLDFTIVPDQETFSGRTTIDATVVKPTRVVWLNATELQISSASLGGQKARVIPGGEDFVGFTTEAELEPGPVTIDVTYTGAIDRARSRGIYAAEEQGAWYAYTFFEPIDARRAFPCFDQPDGKVPWKLVFHVKADHGAYANAAIERTVDEGDGMKRVEMAESKPMPSYLVAFMVGPFDVVDGGTAGRIKTPIQFIVPKGHREELGYAKRITPKVVAALEDYFDMDYPYGKLDVAVVPRYWGTMEHPGIVAMGQPLTLIKPGEETRDRKEYYTNILAHELAHYWFGDLVTLAWWNDTWLNESLGQWMDAIITDAAEPTWRFGEGRLGQVRDAMDVDEMLTTRAIRQPVDTKEGIGSSFDGAITYTKGQSVLTTFQHWVGLDAWRDFIRAYVTKFAWKNATADDFLAMMTEMLGAPQAEAFATFLEQPGVPLVEHTLVCDGTPRLELAQRRSLPAGVTAPSAQLWKFPVCARYGTGKDAHRTCVLLTEPKGTLPLEGGKCPAWLTTNAGGTGYYRSRYTVAEAKAVLGAKSPLTMPERAVVIADVAAAIDRDEIAAGDAMALAPLVLADADERLRGLALGLTGPLRTNDLDEATLARYKKWVLATFGPAARKLGWRRKAGDTDDRQRLRAKLVGIVAWAGDKALAPETAKLAKAWLADPSALEDDIVDTVLSRAAHTGDAALFDAVVTAAKATTDVSRVTRLMVALGYFTDPALAERARGYVFGTEFDFRDAKLILFMQAMSRETRDGAWAYVKENLDKLLANQRSDEAGWFIGGIGGVVCDTARRDEVKAVFGPRVAAIDGAQYAFDTAIDAVDRCIAAQARVVPSVKKRLEKY
jgi:aminopeptidase N